MDKYKKEEGYHFEFQMDDYITYKTLFKFPKNISFIIDVPLYSGKAHIDITKKLINQILLSKKIEWF